jgi:hypothetical protein
MARREQVAEQLRALLQRHNLMPVDIEKKTETDGKTPVSAVTVRRILKAEARTEPEPGTLRRIAEAVGESYTTAFPEADDALGVDVSQRGGRFFIRFLGDDVPTGLEADLKRVLERYEKKGGSKKSKTSRSARA